MKNAANISNSEYSIFGGPLNPQSYLYYSEGKPEMLLDLDYGINDSHCNDICLLSQKIILYIPTQLIKVSADDRIELHQNIKQTLQFLKENNNNGARIFALLPKNISDKHLDLLNNYLANTHNITIIKNINSEMLFCRSNLSYEKILTVLGKQKRVAFDRIDEREKLLTSFNPLVCNDYITSFNILVYKIYLPTHTLYYTYLLLYAHTYRLFFMNTNDGFRTNKHIKIIETAYQ